MIEPLRTILSELRAAEGNPQSGWILRGLNGKPASLDYLAREHIMPILREKKIAWKGYYSGRRGIGTKATQEARDEGLAAKGLLRHSNGATTTAHYVKGVPEETRRAMEGIEQQTLALMAKRNTELCGKRVADREATDHGRR